jgi:hypothetical protein
VDHVPDPLLLRKCGSAGNRTRTSGCSQELWRLYHRGGRLLEQMHVWMKLPSKEVVISSMHWGDRDCVSVSRDTLTLMYYGWLTSGSLIRHVNTDYHFKHFEALKQHWNYCETKHTAARKVVFPFGVRSIYKQHSSSTSARALIQTRFAQPHYPSIINKVVVPYEYEYTRTLELFNSYDILVEFML